MEVTKEEMENLIEQRDKTDVIETEYRYIRALDTGDWRSVVKLFHKDAKLYVRESGEKRPVGGLPEIEAMYKDLAGRKVIFQRHYITVPLATVNGQTATFWSYYNAMFVHDAFTRLNFGVYDDQLIKENGEWKFIEKIFGWDWHEFLVPIKDLKARNVDIQKIWPLP